MSELDPGQTPVDRDAAGPSSPLRSVHTTHFPELLTRLGASLLMTTYQAVKLVVVRNQAGKVNTHFRSFEAPMRLALHGGRLSVVKSLERFQVGTGLLMIEVATAPVIGSRTRNETRWRNGHDR